MLSRLIVAVIVLFSIAASSPGAPLYPLNDATLLDTVHKLKLKNYAGARESALKASPAKQVVPPQDWQKPMA